MENLIKGRGAAGNPPNRFELIRYEPLEDGDADERPAPATQFFRDATASIIVTNDSPDVPFNASINVYRGCEHGCVYCYARPYHEYLGFSIGLDFETKIMVKEDAPALLRKELSAKKWKPQTLGMSGVTDCVSADRTAVAIDAAMPGGAGGLSQSGRGSLPRIVS